MSTDERLVRFYAAEGKHARLGWNGLVPVVHVTHQLGTPKHSLELRSEEHWGVCQKHVRYHYGNWERINKWGKHASTIYPRGWLRDAIVQAKRRVAIRAEAERQMRS